MLGVISRDREFRPYAEDSGKVLKYFKQGS